LLDFLQHEHLLYVLDNFEHVMDAAPFIAEIRWPSLVSIAGGKRVRWWFWSRFTSQKAPAAPSTLVNANERSATLSLETILVSGAMFPADPYEALVIIARGNRQRHERLVTQRS
jgi:hypothetical protein